jgi:hypothetical protein
MACPGNRFEALLLQFGLAIQARSKRVVPDAVESFVDLLQGRAVGIILAEQEFLGV